MYVYHRNGFKNCNMGKQSSLLKGFFFKGCNVAFTLEKASLLKGFFLKRLQCSLYFRKSIFVERVFS
jgi:hypothetical protein